MMEIEGQKTYTNSAQHNSNLFSFNHSQQELLQNVFQNENIQNLFEPNLMLNTQQYPKMDNAKSVLEEIHRKKYDQQIELLYNISSYSNVESKLNTSQKQKQSKQVSIFEQQLFDEQKYPNKNKHIEVNESMFFPTLSMMQLEKKSQLNQNESEQHLNSENKNSNHQSKVIGFASNTSTSTNNNNNQSELQSHFFNQSNQDGEYYNRPKLGQYNNQQQSTSQNQSKDYENIDIPSQYNVESSQYSQQLNSNIINENDQSLIHQDNSKILYVQQIEQNQITKITNSSLSEDIENCDGIEDCFQNCIEQTNNNMNSNIQNKVENLPMEIKLYHKILICGGLILFDGILRNKGLVHASFGYQQELVAYVEEKKKLNTMSVFMRLDESVRIPSSQEAIHFFEQTFTSSRNLENLQSMIPQNLRNSFTKQILSNGESMRIAKNKIQNHMDYRNSVKRIFNNFAIEENMLKWRDDDFSVFVDQCYKYLSGYGNNQTQMYQYSIGIYNSLVQDVQNQEVGYSNAYLSMLGIDSQSFSTMVMRGNKVDLIKEKDIIQEQTLYIMLMCFFNIIEYEIYQDIVTFDGFPLRIHLKNKKIQMSFHQKTPQKEYVLYVSEIDVDVKELQRLINYRQQISKKNNKLSYEDFIRRELSYLFEDVEYSVRSQAFLEKYYQINLEKLDKLKKTLNQIPLQQRFLQNPSTLLKPVQYDIAQRQ